MYPSKLGAQNIVRLAKVDKLAFSSPHNSVEADVPAAQYKNVVSRSACIGQYRILRIILHLKELEVVW
jgi:hypothetical protein